MSDVPQPEGDTQMEVKQVTKAKKPRFRGGPLMQRPARVQV
ncbi:hypothetical protein KIPB_009865, partial [Kipferlia bialata]|eukprot:g9865.t1